MSEIVGWHKADPRCRHGYVDQAQCEGCAVDAKLAASQDRNIDLLLVINKALAIIDKEIEDCPFTDTVLVRLAKILREQK